MPVRDFSPTPTPSIANGQSVLGADFNTTLNNTWQDSGLSVTLPAPGTYLVRCDVGFTVNVSVQLGIFLAKLFNSTDGADVANSHRRLMTTATTGTYIAGTATLTMIVTVAASKTIKLYVQRSTAGGATYTLAQVTSNATDGYTVMQYVRLN